MEENIAKILSQYGPIDQDKQECCHFSIILLEREVLLSISCFVEEFMWHNSAISPKGRYSMKVYAMCKIIRQVFVAMKKHYISLEDTVTALASSKLSIKSFHP